MYVNTFKTIIAINYNFILKISGGDTFDLKMTFAAGLLKCKKPSS